MPTIKLFTTEQFTIQTESFIFDCFLNVNNMPRAKGTTKTGGRQKGTKNKTSAELKEWLLQFVSKNTEMLDKSFKDLDNATQWAILIKMMAFVVSKKEEVNINSKQFELWQQANEKMNELLHK